MNIALICVTWYIHHVHCSLYKEYAGDVMLLICIKNNNIHYFHLHFWLPRKWYESLWRCNPSCSMSLLWPKKYVKLTNVKIKASLNWTRSEMVLSASSLCFAEGYDPKNSRYLHWCLQIKNPPHISLLSPVPLHQNRIMEPHVSEQGLKLKHP